MQYKGTFTDIFAALKAFPNGAGDDDFVVISGKIHRWSKHKGTFVTDTVHAPEMPDNNPCITLFTSLTNSGILTDYMGNTTTRHYDSYGRSTGSSTSSMDYLGNRTTRHRDAFGQTWGSSTSSTDYLGNRNTRQRSNDSNSNIWSW